MSIVEQKLKEMGLELPGPGASAGSFCPTMTCGDLIFVSGQASMLKEGPSFTGKLGAEVSVEEGQKSAQLCALRCIGALRGAADLDKIKIIKVTGFVNATPEFTKHPAVINGASDLFLAVFGENGKHARCAVGMSSLPGNASTEVELVAQILK